MIFPTSGTANGLNFAQFFSRTCVLFDNYGPWKIWGKSILKSNFSKSGLEMSPDKGRVPVD